MERKILDYLAAHGGSATYDDIHKAFPGLLETEGFLRELKVGRYISGDLAPETLVNITPKGYALRLELQERENQQQRVEDHHNKQHRTDTWVAALAAVFSGLSLLLTVLQHFGLF